MRLQQVEEGNLISNWRKAVALTAKSPTEHPHCMQKLDSHWGWRLNHCPTMANISRTIYKRSDWRLEQQHDLRCPEGSFSNSVAAFHGLSDSSRRSQEENRGIRLLLVMGLGMPCVLGVFIWFDWLILIWGLFWFFERRLEMGLEAIWGEAQKAALGTHAVPMEIRGSSLRLVCSFGCCWRRPCRRSTAHLWDCLCSGSRIISDYQNFWATR